MNTESHTTPPPRLTIPCTPGLTTSARAPGWRNALWPTRRATSFGRQDDTPVMLPLELLLNIPISIHTPASMNIARRSQPGARRAHICLSIPSVFLAVVSRTLSVVLDADGVQCRAPPRFAAQAARPVEAVSSTLQAHCPNPAWAKPQDLEGVCCPTLFFFFAPAAEQCMASHFARRALVVPARQHPPCGCGYSRTQETKPTRGEWLFLPFGFCRWRGSDSRERLPVP